jgi:pimeloyl-ACP methyl ester carboxylesterase
MQAPMQMQMNVLGEGRPLVLVGGGLTGWLSFVPHQERLRASRRVARAQLLTVQLGLEERPLPDGYSIRMESDALGAAVDEMEREAPVDLVAWSYGAAVTLDYALGHRDRVRTLTLIEPPAFWVLEATGRMDAVSRRERDELEALHREMASDVSEAQLARFVTQAALCPPGTRPEDLPAWPVWVEHRRSLRNGPAVFAHTDDAARLRTFDRPVLLFKGTGSTPVFHRIVDALADTLPRAEAVELPGGHAPQIAAIDDFLARLATFQEQPR